MKIRIRKSAIRDLKKIDRQQKESLHLAIRNLENFPKVTNIKKLTNFEPAFRLKVGNYRILFDISGNEIVIGRVLHRKNSYKSPG